MQCVAVVLDADSSMTVRKWTQHCNVLRFTTAVQELSTWSHNRIVLVACEHFKIVKLWWDALSSNEGFHSLNGKWHLTQPLPADWRLYSQQPQHYGVPKLSLIIVLILPSPLFQLIKARRLVGLGSRKQLQQQNVAQHNEWLIPT